MRNIVALSDGIIEVAPYVLLINITQKQRWNRMLVGIMFKSLSKQSDSCAKLSNVRSPFRVLINSYLDIVRPQHLVAR